MDSEIEWMGEAEKKGQIGWNKQKEQERDHIHWLKVHKNQKTVGAY